MEYNFGYNAVDIRASDDKYVYSGIIELNVEDNSITAGTVRAGDLAEDYPLITSLPSYKEDDLLVPRPMYIFNTTALPQSYFSMGIAQGIQGQFYQQGTITFKPADPDQEGDSRTSAESGSVTTDGPMDIWYEGEVLMPAFHSGTSMIHDWGDGWYIPNQATFRPNVPLFNSRLHADAIYTYLVTGNNPLEDEEEREDDDDQGNPPTNKDQIIDNAPSDATAPSVAIAGACNPYVATVDEIKTFFNWFWNDMIKEIEATGEYDAFVKEALQAYGDLRKNIVSIRHYPFQVPRAEADKVVLGRFVTDNTLLKLDTSHNKLCTFEGDVTYKFNGFIDFAYTDVSLYLPYYGVVPLSAPEVMGRHIVVDYYVDFSTGGLDIFIMIEKQGKKMVINHLTCAVGSNVMYDLDSGYSANELVSNWAINSGKNVASSIVSGAGALATAVGGPIVGAGVGLGMSALNGAINSIPDLKTQQDNIMGQLPSNDNISCFNFKPTIYISRPIIVPPDKRDYGKHIGFCCNRAYKLNDDSLKGFTQIDNPRIEFKVGAPTDEEIGMIYDYLQRGVIL